MVKEFNLNLSKKHGIYSVSLGLLGLIIPIFAPFALWQGIKARRNGDSTWGLMGFIIANIALALWVVRIVFIGLGYFDFRFGH